MTLGGVPNKAGKISDFSFLKEKSVLLSVLCIEPQVLARAEGMFTLLFFSYLFGARFFCLQLELLCLQLSFFAYGLLWFFLDALSHCKQRSSIVSKKARIVSKKAQGLSKKAPKHNGKQKSSVVSMKLPIVSRKASSVLYTRMLLHYR